ncbi:hypothetical protein GC098_24365 [Paenibacillus sp. LMG 31458]|uniref:Carbohydrate-binding domain-containing protein n=1 Tax=Paenibacillus phytorum TaxID=2654977 RepID=A0ABX1Y115_9BACL|nr:sugar-binding protein [Paenibacillus phytorum]NOU74493.1 hypothetical protein [Paenibacillus phytorum]
MIKKLGVILLAICLSGIWNGIGQLNADRVYAVEETESVQEVVMNTSQPALAAADFNYLISDFEQGNDEWIFSLGDTPAVKGSLNVIESVYSYQGSYTGQLLADFSQRPTGSPYVLIKKEMEDLDITQFAFWVKTTDLKSVRIRTTDSTGQTFQQRITLQDKSDWQQVVVSQMGSKSFTYWNGANDGIWHKPVRNISIFFDRFDIKNGALTAAVLVDQITAQVTVPPKDFDHVISDFEQGNDEWIFSLGDTPAVKGSLNVMESVYSYQGNYTGQILADFSKSPTGSPYASIKKTVDDLDIEQLALWVKTSDLKSVRIRTTDSTGQTFEQRITLQNTSDWQQIVLSQMGSKSFTHWNGANDGIWHEPAGAITILFDRFDIKNGSLTASILVDQITAQLGGWLPELKIQQTALGNIFLDHDPNAFIVRSGRPIINWTAYDIYGARVASGSERTNAGEARITVPFSKLGYFTLEVSAEQSGSEPLVRKTAYTVVSSALPSGNGNSPFGVSTHMGWTASGWSKELSKLIRYMGASYVRDGIEWSSIEKEKGVYTFTPTPDDYMKKLADNDIKLLLVAAFNNPFYDNNGTPFTDAGRRGLAEYAKAYVGSYKDQLIGFNVYNEFNGGFGKRGNSPANSQPDYYFKLMKETYNVVKPAYPDVPVVGIVSGGVDLNWIEGVLKGVGEGEDKNAGLKYLDAVSVQTYMDPNAPDEVFAKLEDLKTLIKKYNDGKLVPIWVTEFGSPTHQSAKGVDEKTQANYLPRGFVKGLELGLERMNWYDFMNDGLKADYNEDNFGLVRHKDDPMGAYTPKPAYASYAAMSRQLDGAAFERIEQFSDPIKSNLFSKAGEALRVVWASEETQAVIETGNIVEVTDFMGNTEIYTPHNGKIYMTLTGEPVYIKGVISRIVKDDTFAVFGEQGAVGDPHTFTLTAKNETGPKLAITAKMEESSYPLVAMQGQMTTLSLTVSETREGFRSVAIHLLDEAGNKIGKLQHEVVTGMPHKVTVRPAMQQIAGQYSQMLNVDVENFRKAAGLTVSRITWRVGGQSGQELVNKTVLPGSKQQFSIPLSPIALGGDQPASIRVEFAEQKPYVYEGNFSFNPVNRGTIAVNDRIEPEIEALAPTIDLSQGKPVLLSGHRGKIEVSGQAWLHYDQDHLYLTAKIKDDVHAAAAFGANIWKNDSIQFALSPGIPGESLGWYEYGVSDTPDGPQIYRWTTMGGLPAGPVHNGEAAVTRDEEQKLTIYKLALPWSELTPIQPQSGDVMSFSLLVNENDGNGRKGWVEWGSGIGNEKRPSLFRSMQWIMPSYKPLIQIDGIREGEVYTDKVTPAVRLLDESGDWTITRMELDGEAWTTGSAVTEKGKHSFSVLAESAYGQQVSETVSFQLFHSMAVEVRDSSGAYGNEVYLEAELKDANGQSVAGGQVEFEVNGLPVGRALTDANGKASLPYAIEIGATAETDSRLIEVKAIYAGNEEAYTRGTEANGILTVTKDEVAIQYTSILAARTDENLVLSAHVMRVGGGHGSVEGLPVEFVLSAINPDGTVTPLHASVVQQVYMTDAVGNVFLGVDLPAGLYEVRTKLLANDYYKASETVSHLAVYDPEAGSIELNGHFDLTGNSSFLGNKAKKAHLNVESNHVRIHAEPQGIEWTFDTVDWVITAEDRAYLQGSANSNGKTYTVRMMLRTTPDSHGKATISMLVWNGSDTTADPVFQVIGADLKGSYKIK